MSLARLLVADTGAWHKRTAAMLTSLRIQNFKSWADTGELRLAPITGLFGANSSGKSSILQFLLMLKQTAESSDRAQVLNFGFGDSRSLVNLGTFPELRHGHGSSVALEWSLRWTPFGRVTTPIQTEPVDLNGTGYSFTFAARVMEQLLPPPGTPVVDWFRYGFSNRSTAKTAFEVQMRRETLETDRYEVSLRGPTQPNLSKTLGGLPPPVKCYGFPPQAYAAIPDSELARGVQLRFEEMLGSVDYLGPVRSTPKREYAWGGGRPSSVGAQGEYAIEALLASEARRETTLRSEAGGAVTLQDIVNQQLQSLGLVTAFGLADLGGTNVYRAYITRGPNAKVLLPDVGFGVSQILPVLVLCYYAPEGSTIILEQPEMHLHPAVQAGLADVLIDAMQKRHVQFIVESHSEHLLRRLQRRIADEKLQSTEAALYFCESDAETGASQATELALDEYGNIKNWPKDFFGDEMGELVAMTRAEMQRRSSDAPA